MYSKWLKIPKCLNFCYKHYWNHHNPYPWQPYQVWGFFTFLADLAHCVPRHHLSVTKCTSYFIFLKSFLGWLQEKNLIALELRKSIKKVWSSFKTEFFLKKILWLHFLFHSLLFQKSQILNVLLNFHVFTRL